MVLIYIFLVQLCAYSEYVLVYMQKWRPEVNIECLSSEFSLPLYFVRVSC